MQETQYLSHGFNTSDKFSVYRKDQQTPRHHAQCLCRNVLFLSSVAPQNCGFAAKAWAAQRGGYTAVVVYGREADGAALVTMAARGADDVTGLAIPAVYVTYATGRALATKYAWRGGSDFRYVITIGPVRKCDYTFLSNE